MKRLKTPVCLFLCAAVLVFGVFRLVTPARAEEKSAFGGILRLWNIDCFEGGKGSRAAFLNEVAASYEKAHEGVYVMVTSMSAEGCANALKEGNVPDMVSFGCGVNVSAYAQKLAGYSFAGGAIGGDTFAYPWCRGGYVLYSLDGDFSYVSANNTVLSSGGNNVEAIAAALAGWRGEYPEKTSTSAYVEFLNGKYKYLLGTQRDAFRFRTRGANVYAQVLSGYCDLYQYFSILTDDEERYSACLAFLNLLTDEKTQQNLTEIGMASLSCEVYAAGDGVLYDIQQSSPAYVLNAFTDKAAVAALKPLAAEVLRDGDTKKLKNYLKTIA